MKFLIFNFLGNINFLKAQLLGENIWLLVWLKTPRFNYSKNAFATNFCSKWNNFLHAMLSYSTLRNLEMFYVYIFTHIPLSFFLLFNLVIHYFLKEGSGIIQDNIYIRHSFSQICFWLISKTSKPQSISYHAFFQNLSGFSSEPHRLMRCSAPLVPKPRHSLPSPVNCSEMVVYT